MQHFLAALVLTFASLAFAAPLAAQDDDSRFDSYAQYNAFVDRMITTREWVEFVKRMGGRDEYTEEQLAKIASDFNGLYRRPFTSVSLFREVDLGGGIRQEARAYWGGGRYLFFYAILHERKDAIIVLNFAMNTKVERIMEKF